MNRARQRTAEPRGAHRQVLTCAGAGAALIAFVILYLVLGPALHWWARRFVSIRRLVNSYGAGPGASQRYEGQRLVTSGEVVAVTSGGVVVNGGTWRETRWDVLVQFGASDVAQISTHDWVRLRGVAQGRRDEVLVWGRESGQRSRPVILVGATLLEREGTHE